MGKEYIKFIQIRHKEDCFADPNRIRIMAQSDRKFDDLLPYIASQFPNAVFSPENGFLSWREGRRLVSIFSTGKIGVTYLKDENEARQILEKIKEKINWVYRNKHKIDISGVTKRKPLNALQIYRYLPGLNCKKCGFPTCMAFAVKLISLEITPAKCMPLFEESKYEGRRKALIETLDLAGFL